MFFPAHKTINNKTNKKSLLKPLIGLCALLSVNCYAVSQTSMTINTSKPQAVINKNIYGQFAEHLGHGIYEGIWVGENSDIANTDGFRDDVISALQALEVPLVRWPGGCFADEYHWRDGIGDVNKRPIKVNTHWGGVEETNRFGTHEFFKLAKLLNAETYINGNLGTGTPQEMAEWLEYMTSDKNSTLADMRRKNGSEQPFKVDYFGIGNEAWGCGGHMRPEYYADLYSHYATFLKTPKDKTPKFVASGGHTADTSWTEVLSKNITRDISGISYHYYTLPTGEWDVKGAAINFPESQWFSTFVNTQKIDGYIKNNIEILEKNDPKGNIGFYVDEWGTWFDAEKGREPGLLYQQKTIRDALVAALNFNIFHKYAKRVHMTNIAQMVNVLQAMILTDDENMLLTPTYHAYKMYIPFQNAKTLPITVSDKSYYKFEQQSIEAISSSAAISEDGKVYLSLVNISADESAEVTVKLDQKSLKQAIGSQLTGAEMDAHNTFTQPNRVHPNQYSVNGKAGTFTFSLPAKSVTVVHFE